MMYPTVSPSQVLGTVVEGLVSYIESPFFWIQREPDAVCDLCAGHVGDVEAGQALGQGDCVTGKWEDDWYRGVVVEEKESEFRVNFVDWGNTESVAKGDVRKSVKEEMTIIVGALKCSLVEEGEGWEDELQTTDYKAKLKCVAVYDGVHFMSRKLGLDLCMNEEYSGEVMQVSQGKSAWFFPSSFQASLDAMMDQLDLQASSLTHLSITDVFIGQLCGARFSEDEGMYRAEIISVGENVVEVLFIDYGNTEEKSMQDLFLLPKTVLAPCPHIVKVKLEDCEKLVSKCGVVIKMQESEGEIIASLVDEREEAEIKDEGVLKQKDCLEEELPVNVRIPVIVGHVETVDKVWVTPDKKVKGIEASNEMVTQVEAKLAFYQSNPTLLARKSSMHKGDMALAIFTQDSLLYRVRVEEGSMVRFVDYGNTEEKNAEDLYEVPEELLKFPVGAVGVTIAHNNLVKNTEENIDIDLVDAKLKIRPLCLEMGEDGRVVFYHEDLKLSFFEYDNPENLSSKKGKIIEVGLDEENSEAGAKYDLVRIPVDVTYVDSVESVWAIKMSDKPALEEMMDKLANLRDELAPVVEICEEDVVIAISSDDELYRGKVVSVKNKLVRVRLVDYGMLEDIPTDRLWKLPDGFRKPDFMAELVMVEGVGGFVNSPENIELLDMQLNRDGVVMVLNEDSKASFWINDEKLLFPLSGQGWSVGDEVTYWTEESKRWDKGVISSLGENMATVQGGVGDIHDVEYKNLKSPGMPVEALNMVEVELGSSENNDEKPEGGNGDKVEAKCSFEDVFKNKSSKPTFVFPNPLTMKDDDGEYNDGKKELKVKSEDILAQSFPPSQPYAEHEFKAVSLEAHKLNTEEHLAKTNNFQKTSNGRVFFVIKHSRIIFIIAGKTGVKKRVSAVFQPTESITQQMMDDWIAGCLEMLAQSKLNKCKFDKNIFEATDEDDKDAKHEEMSIAERGDNVIVDASEEEVGPESQSVEVTPSSLCPSKDTFSPTCPPLDTVSRHDILARIDRCPQYCEVVQKVCPKLTPSQLTMLIRKVSQSFVPLATHSSGHQVVLAVLTVIKGDQVDTFISQLEDKAVLKSLIMDKFGVSVLQRMFPLIQPGGAAAIASVLQGMIVEVSTDPHGSVFLQEFFRLFFNTEMVDILLEEVMDNLSTLAVHDISTWLVLEVIKRDDKPRAGYLMRVACWVVKNVETVLVSSAGASLARMVLQLLMSRINCKEVSSFRGLLGNLVTALLDTTVEKDGVEMPLILKAAEHPHGHIVVLELAANKSYLVENRDRMLQILTQHKSKLEIGTFGCLVMKGMHWWL